ncbi:MAG: lactate dehydrogenase [Candidatus Hepatoplasma vulgare]|nr:MAG: lactate dehydrogenase [Candidatus Hepatoplasma sp.]
MNIKKAKIICYGVRENEREYFNKLNKPYGYELVFVDSFKIDENNLKLAKGCDAIMVRENVFLKEEHLKVLKEMGVKYLLTRTAGFDHINIKAAQELGFYSLQRVPVYSPNAIAELSVALGMTLLRKVQYTADRAKDGDYTITDIMLSKEVRKSVVGILGTGKIGYVTAELYKGLGAKIIGYDPYPNENYKNLIEYVSLDKLLKESDIISVHCPLMDSTKHIISKANLDKVKDDVVIINAGRGALTDTKDMITFLKANPKATYGTDVIEGEEELFFKKYDKNNIPSILKEVGNLYPRFLVTPHVGAVTFEALKNTIEVSFENLNNALSGKELVNNLFK